MTTRKKTRVGINWAETFNKLVSGENAVTVRVTVDPRTVVYLGGLGVGLITFAKIVNKK